MDTKSIIAEIDGEIARLQQVRAMLTGGEAPKKKGPGRPRKNPVVTEVAAQPKRGTMSAAGRARIAAAQKARWAKMRKTAKGE